jgi:Acetyltransferases, including N-acetylases of ribosomal proteins
VKILETERLILREIVQTDADFILDLLNQPSFIRYIGDRNVRTADDARYFIKDRCRKSYRLHGFGVYTVELKETCEAAGICGFIKRDFLPDADIGFAFLPQFEKKGYAFESASAVLEYGKKFLNFKRVLAITTLDNENSGRLLAKLGFRFERLIKSPENDDLKLFSKEL